MISYSIVCRVGFYKAPGRGVTSNPDMAHEYDYEGAIGLNSGDTIVKYKSNRFYSEAKRFV